MIYEIRHFDLPLIRFSAAEDTSELEIKILWVNEGKRELIPLEMSEVNEREVYMWLKHRTIPKNRAYVQNFLSKCGLSSNRTMGIIKVSKGLSLNDCYWVVEEGFNGTFDKNNLYENNFSRVLAQIAFTGYGSSGVRSTFASSPEFTTDGMLRKCWRRQGGKVKLYKGGTEGAANTGNEPYSEFYAYQIAKKMGIKAVEYNLSKWKSSLCSTCGLFTTKERSFVPVSKLVTSGGMEAVREYYKTLGREYVSALDDMLVLDALIVNTDRHFGNFGVIVDSRTNKIIEPAPLFDHGNSLFNYAMGNDLRSIDKLMEYADTLLPRNYDDFIGTAKGVLTNRHCDHLRGMLEFSFTKHPRYNWSKGRLKLVEKVVRLRVEMLLK